jgi:hypothetical protein
VAFEERRQGPAESFDDDDFCIGLRRLAEATDLCGTCVETRLVTHVITGVQDAETKKKLLAMCPFPLLQQTVNICQKRKSRTRK